MKEKISSLKRNYNIYPREGLDGFNVIRIRNAIEAGVELPPVIADKKTKMVIDGFHRIEAVKLISGPDGEILVDYHEYKNLAEMFLDAVRLNAAQGKTLLPNDIERIIEVAHDLEITPKYLAGALSMTASRIKGFEPTRIDASISVQDPGIQRARSVVAELVKIPEVIKKKKPENKCQLYFIRQVINFIEQGVDMEDEKLMGRLEELYRLLKEIF